MFCLCGRIMSTKVFTAEFVVEELCGGCGEKECRKSSINCGIVKYGKNVEIDITVENVTEAKAVAVQIIEHNTNIQLRLTRIFTEQEEWDAETI